MSVLHRQAEPDTSLRTSNAKADQRIVRPATMIYALDEWPPPLRLLLLGLQYAVMAAIYLVLVAIILRHTNSSDAEAMRAMGVGCLALAIGAALQALWRGPIGSGFLAPPVFSATYLGPSVLAAAVGGMRLVAGMTLFAGLIEVLFGLALTRLRLIVTPILGGLTMFVVGLQLGIVGIGETLDIQHEALPNYVWHFGVATTTLVTCVALSIWGRGSLRLLCTLIGLLVGMVGASAIGMLEPGRLIALRNAAWVALPHPTMFYGFDIGLAPAFAAAGIAAAMRTTGVITTCQRINDAAWHRPDMDNVRRGVLADGIATIVSGALGVPGMSAGPSLVGVSNATRATSRVIAFAAAILLAVAAFFPKVPAIFLLVPHEVAGALLVFTASFMITGGMELMLSRSADTRAIYVIGVSTLLALSKTAFPAYFQHLPAGLRSVTDSALALGLIAAIVLTLLFRIGVRQKAETAWDASDASIDAAATWLRRTARGWKIAPDALDLCAADARQVMAYISSSLTVGGQVLATFDGTELRVDMLFHGSPDFAVPPAERRGITESAVEIDNEEAAVLVGLRNFLHGLTADRKQLVHRSGRMIVRLGFGT